MQVQAGRDGSGAVASEGRLVENPLLNAAAASGKTSAGVKKAAALFDTTSLWAIGMLRRYAVSITGYLSPAVIGCLQSCRQDSLLPALPRLSGCICWVSDRCCIIPFHNLT